MTIRTYKTRSGNFIVKMDAFDPLWNATIAGGTVAHVMLPAACALQECEDGHYGIDPVLGGYFTESELVHKAARGEIPGARVYEYRQIH